MASLVVNHLCTIGELSRALGVNRKNIERYVKTYHEHGPGYFFNRPDGRGQCHKLTEDLRATIQEKLDAGLSQYRIAREHGISDSAIAYHINKGTLKKKEKPVTPPGNPQWSQPCDRALDDLSAAGGMGMAATRVDERLLASLGLSPVEPVRFESCRSISGGGVMLLLPFLMECGLLSYREHYRQRDGGYYDFDSLFILMAFLLLGRVKSFEQTKRLDPGEWGKMIGYDRIPEVRALRSLVREVTGQERCAAWSAELARRWIRDEEPGLYYVDGHVQVYHGHLAELGRKHVSRQRLCLPGMMEFRVNSASGMPFFFVTSQVNERMIEMLDGEIIPKLMELHPVSREQRALMEENPDYPLFTLVFDREAYSPSFFKRLWDEHHIAVITYRKNVKDKWDDGLFSAQEVETSMGPATMELCERETTLDGYAMREARKRSGDGHQSSIITNNKIITLALIASYMFGRWVQENFFRYMRQEYAIDKIVQYGVEQLDDNIMVVNREYSNITYRIKKEREKLSRRQAKLFILREGIPEKEKQSRAMAGWIQKQTDLLQQIQEVEEEIARLIEERSGIPYKIPLSRMPEQTRYNKLHQESKHLQNIVKMICYRAETAMANLLAPHFTRSRDEVRALVKSIISRQIDMHPDYDNGTLEITLYPLSNNRNNEAVSKILETLNRTQTKYPGTDLVLL